MNRKRLLKLADHMESLPALRYKNKVPVMHLNGEAVCMSAVILRGSARMDVTLMTGECGTVGCIAGHALCLFDPENKKTQGYWSDRASHLLGLSVTEGDHLFQHYPWSCGNLIDGDDCAGVLRDIANGQATAKEAWAKVELRYGVES